MMLMPLWLFLRYYGNLIASIMFVIGLILCVSSFLGCKALVKSLLGFGFAVPDSDLACGDRAETTDPQARSVMRLPPEPDAFEFLVKIALGFGLIVLGLALMLPGFEIVFGDWLETADSRASCVMRLPSGAQVVSAECGDWAGDGKVVFRLPANRQPNLWFEEIWKSNKSRKPNAVAEDQPPPLMKRTETVDEDRRSLEYDSETRLYRYEVRLGL